VLPAKKQDFIAWDALTSSVTVGKGNCGDCKMRFAMNFYNNDRKGVNKEWTLRCVRRDFLCGAKFGSMHDLCHVHLHEHSRTPTNRFAISLDVCVTSRFYKTKRTGFVSNPAVDGPVLLSGTAHRTMPNSPDLPGCRKSEHNFFH